MTPSEAALHALTQAAKEGRLTTHLRNPPAPVNTFTGKNISPQARAAMRGAEIQIGKNPKLLPAQRNRERGSQTKAKRENTWVSQKDNPR